MKRYIVLAALCLVLAVSIPVVGSAAINRTEAQVEQAVTISWGDASALEGLTVKTAITYDQKLLWETTRDVAAGESKTDFSFHTVDVPMIQSDTVDGRAYRLYFRLCDNKEKDDPICRILEKLDDGSGAYYDISLQDYYDTYPLYLGDFFYAGDELNDVLVTTESDWSGTAKAFTPLQIPVEAEDELEVYFRQETANSYSRFVSASYIRLAHRYRPLSQPYDGGILVSAGFAPDAEPKTEWAPDGFGIWMVPIEDERYKNDIGLDMVKKVIRTDRTRVVYPLDIETQSVLALQWSGDGNSLLLVTAENGEAVLRVLDGTTYQVQSTISLGAIEATAEEYVLYLDSGERTVSRTDYEEVQIHTEADFTAIAVGKHLTVLVPDSKGYQVDFSCDIMPLYTVHEGEERVFFWEDDEAAAQKYSRIDNCYSPVYGTYCNTFDRIPMIYRDHKLAMAWYAYDYDYSAHLHVYGPEGVIYAERTESSLQQQDISLSHDFRLPNDLPELDWAA